MDRKEIIKTSLRSSPGLGTKGGDPGGREWKCVFDRLGGVQQVTRTTELQKLVNMEPCINYANEQLAIEYMIYIQYVGVYHNMCLIYFHRETVFWAKFVPSPGGQICVVPHYTFSVTVIMGAMASQITSLTIVRLNCLFRRRWKKTSKFPVTGLCEGNSPVNGEFPAQMASNAENVSIWWRHHGMLLTVQCSLAIHVW